MDSNLPRISPIARAYALALLNVAAQAGQEADVAADFAALRLLANTAPETVAFLKAASISTDEKLRVLQKTLQPVLNPLTFRTIQSLGRRNRLELLHELIDAFDALSEERKNRITVELTAAAPVSSEDQTLFEQAMSRKLGKEVTLRTKQKKELIGGAQLRIGELLIDGSVRYQLNKMRQHLSRQVLLGLQDKKLAV
jgi:F-type H+-transporting ATPase subunit delta